MLLFPFIDSLLPISNSKNTEYSSSSSFASSDGEPADFDQLRDEEEDSPMDVSEEEEEEPLNEDYEEEEEPVPPITFTGIEDSDSTNQDNYLAVGVYKDISF